MSDSGTVTDCPLCGAGIEPFGQMRHRFFAEDLQEGEICIECARKVAPDQVDHAEAMERQWARSDRGS